MIRRIARVTSLGLLALIAALPTSVRSDDGAGAEIHAYLTRLEKLGFAGSVVLAQGGEPILAKGYGLADRGRGIPWTPSTVSTIGSITKQFTGAAILSLVEKGLLSVDDLISEYFDDVPEDKRDITLYQLLTHSSGIIDLADGDDWDPIGREEFIRRAMEQELAFAPGEGHEYSNAGFSLLGAIIEQLTGQSYEEYLRERFFLPVGMYETGYILAPWGEAQVAQGYRGGETWGTVIERPFAEDGPYWVLRANGGIHSTAWDMLRWGQALLDGEPLSSESMATYWEPGVDEGYGDSFYGYGWVVMDRAGTKVITHNGGNGILFADMAIVPEAETVAVIQTNVAADFPLAEQLLEHLGARLLMGEPLPSVPDWDVSGTAKLDSWAGSYTLTGSHAVTGGGVLTVTASDNELRIEPADSAAFRSLLSTRPVDSVRADRLAANIDAIVGAYLSGDWRPLWEAYGRPMPLESLAARGGQRLDRLIDENGAVKGHSILGTAFRDGRDVTLARIDFENGEIYRAYVWDPEEQEALLGVSGRGLDHILHVLPEVGGTLATWDRAGVSLPVRFEAVEGGGVRLAIGDAGVEAVRED